jgi:hypothetical protein
MTDPVTISWGHIFDRVAITTWFVTNNRCPIDNKYVNTHNLFPATDMRSVIENYIQSHPEHGLEQGECIGNIELACQLLHGWLHCEREENACWENNVRIELKKHVGTIIPLHEERQKMESTPAEFECPITRHIMTDPVTIACGHTFQKEAIEKRLLSSK